jgi:DNA-binding transcriptional ArsR family regulator
MTTDDTEERSARTNDIEAGLFEAISHPTRIKILFSLEDSSLGFSELKRKVGVSSSGNLQHHIGKLSTLITINAGGDYVLTDEGREALTAIRYVRSPWNRDRNLPGIATFIYTLAAYIAWMNLPFIFGTVSQFTPVFAIMVAAISGIIMYPLWWLYFSRRTKRVPDV